MIFEHHLCISADMKFPTFVVCATSKSSDQPALMRNLIRAFEYSMSVKLLTGQHLEFLSLQGGCTCFSKSTLVKMPHCWKSHVAAHISVISFYAF